MVECVIGDWGTTSFRGYAIGCEGEILREATRETGLKRAGQVGFAQALREILQDLDVDSRTPVFLSGMVGSKTGWVETAYIETPVDIRGFATNKIQTGLDNQITIFGGVRHLRQDGRMDVMRGEEVQVFGVLKLYPEAELICLPGTHSKWVHLSNQKIGAFSTWMTGDVFNALTKESIFQTQITDTAFNGSAFDTGLSVSMGSKWLNELFLLRTDYLSGRVTSDEFHSYLSGVCIGSELAAVQPSTKVYLCGSNILTSLYQHALKKRDIESKVISAAEATVIGILALRTCIKKVES